MSFSTYFGLPSLLARSFSVVMVPFPQSQEHESILVHLGLDDTLHRRQTKARQGKRFATRNPMIDANLYYNKCTNSSITSTKITKCSTAYMRNNQHKISLTVIS